MNVPQNHVLMVPVEMALVNIYASVWLDLMARTVQQVCLCFLLYYKCNLSQIWYMFHFNYLEANLVYKHYCRIIMLQNNPYFAMKTETF